MAGVNASQFNIPRSGKPPERKARISLRDLDSSYKNPDKPTNSNRETEDKPETKWSQSEDKLESGLGLNRSQTEVKLKSDPLPVKTTRVKVETKLETKKQKSEDKLETKWSQKSSFSTLSDAEKLVITFINDDCVFNGSLETKEMRVTFISEAVKLPIPTVKKTIQRLEELTHVIRVKFKNGRGGWTIYGLSKDMYDQIRNYRGRFKVEPNWRQSGVKLESKVESEVETSPPSSSSSYINTTTTNYKADTLAENKIQLTDSLTTAGFNQGHIEQLRRDSSLGPEEIQNSLNAFAFDLGFEDVKRKVRSPIGLIMKLLKNGQAYVSEKGYESEEDRLYRELIERAEKKKEEKTKLEAKLINIKFEEWLENISDEEKRNFVEPIGEFMGLIHRDELKEYFKREVYE